MYNYHEFHFRISMMGKIFKQTTKKKANGYKEEVTIWFYYEYRAVFESSQVKIRVVGFSSNTWNRGSSLSRILKDCPNLTY
jgi:hypothetical protein